MPATKDENKNGLWRYQKVVYHPVTGERIVLRKRCFSSKKEAEIAEAVVISEIIGYKGESKLPFEDVIQEYLKYKSKRVNLRTLEKLERLFDGFIIPAVKGKDMVKFSNRDATKFYDQLLEHTESSNYRNKIIEKIKSLYIFAEMQYDLSTNPVRAFKKFKAKKQKRVFQVYSMQEFEQFISTFSEENDYELSIKVFFTILYWAGVRRGECKALKWNDIDFEMDTIRIDEQFINKDPNEGRVCTDDKTENSLRTSYIDKLTMELLNKLYSLRNDSNTYSKDSYIFLRRDLSNPFADTMIENRNKLHAKKSGIKRIRVHDFRHSFASLNYSLGVDPKTISTQMGHSNLTITLDTYVNLFDDKVKERVDIIDKIRGKNKN